MNLSASECTSGCDSGWTLYLQHSSFHNATDGVDDEDNLSMVSDASSGPPHFNEDDDNGYFHPSSVAKNCGKKHKIKQLEFPSYLHDTASSPVFKKNLIPSKNQDSMESNLHYSQGFSAAHFQGRVLGQEHFGFSLSGNQLHENQPVCVYDTKSTIRSRDSNPNKRREKLRR